MVLKEYANALSKSDTNKNPIYNEDVYIQK